jgi:hypothetical protein
MLKRLLISILINTAVLVGIAMRLPQGGLSISPISRSATPILLAMGGVFTLIYDIARPILKFLTTPINWLTLGLYLPIYHQLTRAWRLCTNRIDRATLHPVYHHQHPHFNPQENSVNHVIIIHHQQGSRC